MATKVYNQSNCENGEIKKGDKLLKNRHIISVMSQTSFFFVLIGDPAMSRSSWLVRSLDGEFLKKCFIHDFSRLHFIFEWIWKFYDDMG